MNNITEELLKENLTSWTASTKVQETLGLSSMDEHSFKKELVALETKGLIERMGAKKGLKFKYKTTDGTIETEINDENTVKIITEEPKEKVSKVKKTSKIALEDIPCEITTLDRNEFSAEVTHVQIGQLMTWILRNPGEHSFSIAIKRTAKGVCVKTYKDIFLLSEVLYTREAFSKLIQASGLHNE